MPDYVLVHHGIKGMKWGVRRFQNKDGSLTAAGRARQKLQEAAANRKAKKAEKAENERVQKLMSKPIRKLSAEELKERTARAENERKLRDIERQSNEMAKNGATFAKKLGGKLLNEAAVPALVSAGKSVLTKKLEGMLSKALGVNDDDGFNAFELFKNTDISKWTASQIKEAGKQGEAITALKKAMKTSDTENEGSGNVSRKDVEKTIEKASKATASETKTESSTNGSPAKTGVEGEKWAVRKTEESSSYVPSNSNARSTHEVFKEMYPDNISKLSGYKMTSVEKMSDYKNNTSNAHSYLNDLKGYKMSSLEDLEKYN